MTDQPQPKGSNQSLFTPHVRKKQPRLFLRKFLAQKAEQCTTFLPGEVEAATAVLQQWAAASKEGHLKQKETSLDGEFPTYLSEG